MPSRKVINLYFHQQGKKLVPQIPSNTEFCLYKKKKKKKAQKLFLDKAHIFTDHTGLGQIATNPGMLRSLAVLLSTGKGTLGPAPGKCHQDK